MHLKEFNFIKVIGLQLSTILKGKFLYSFFQIFYLFFRASISSTPFEQLLQEHKLNIHIWRNEKGVWGDYQTFLKL